MSLLVEQKLFATLANDPTVIGLVGTRIFPRIIPAGARLPAVAYSRVSGGRQHSLSGSSGLENPQFQIDCHGQTYALVKALKAAVIAAMEGATLFKALCTGEIDDDADEGTVFRVILEFSIWNRG